MRCGWDSATGARGLALMEGGEEWKEGEGKSRKRRRYLRPRGEALPARTQTLVVSLHTRSKELIRLPCTQTKTTRQLC